MKKTTLAAALALALVSGAAFSADLPSRMILPPLPALPIAETLDWNGFYAGLNAGGAWNSNAAANLLSTPVFVAPGVGEEPWAASSSMASARTLATQGAGFIGGGQIGYNWRVSESFVAGMEADIQGIAGGADSGTSTSLLPTPTAGLNFLTVSSASKAQFRHGSWPRQLSPDPDIARLCDWRLRLWRGDGQDGLFPNSSKRSAAELRIPRGQQ